MPTLKVIITTTAALFVCILIPLLGTFTLFSVIVFKHLVNGQDILLVSLLSAIAATFFVGTQLCGLAARGNIHE